MSFISVNFDRNKIIRYDRITVSLIGFWVRMVSIRYKRYQKRVWFKIHCDNRDGKTENGFRQRDGRTDNECVYRCTFIVISNGLKLSLR